MTNQNFPRRLLDDAIDHAVRELVQADARPGFRRRVFDRLHQPKTLGSWWPTLAIPAIAVVAMFVAVFLRQPAPAPETTVAVSTATPPPPPTADPGRTYPVTPEAPPVQAPTRRELPEFRFGPPSARVTATSLNTAAATETTAALPEEDLVSGPAPIAVAPLAVPPQIVVRPITFSRIDAAGSK
jgi:hypothetical protein